MTRSFLLFLASLLIVNIVRADELPSVSLEPMQMATERTPLKVGYLLGLCQRMLARQEEIHRDLLALANVSDCPVDNSLQPANVREGRRLAGKQREVAAQLTYMIDLLREEGSAIAFQKVLQQLSKDAKAVEVRLNAGNIGKDTLSIERDILETFQELAPALRPARCFGKPPG